MTKFIQKILPALLVCCVVTPSWIRAQSPVTSHVIDLTDAKNHYIRVQSDFVATGDQTELMMAVWTPGSYKVREYARNIDSLEISAKGQPLSYEKVRKNRWQVNTDGVKTFRVSYRLYCNEVSVRSNWVGRSYAVLNGASTFMALRKHLDASHTVRLKLPPKWSRSACSLSAHGDQVHAYMANDFDELVDSPIVAGNVQLYPFTVGKVVHQLVNVGESGYWDGSKAATDLKKMVAAHQEMWNSVPYEKYLFLNVINESGGGLEHDNSTLMMTSRWAFRSPDRYKRWLSLASHEFFHTWNVRRLRPVGLKKYDYETENYTPNLWIAEGITNYYEDLLLVRCGLYKKEDLLASLSDKIRTVQTTPGRKKQSLRESSYDSWIKFYIPDENARNTRISYYSKGAVAAFLLDTEIRRATDGEKSLDDVMRRMFTQFAQRGYRASDFRNTVKAVAGQDMAAWFERAIDSTEELDYSPLNHLGLTIAHPMVQAAIQQRERAEADDLPPQPRLPDDLRAALAAARAAADDQEKKNATLGFRTRSENGKLKVVEVVADSPATTAGVNLGDEVIGLNGFRLTSDPQSQLKYFEVGDELPLLLARRGELIKLSIEVGETSRERWSLKFLPKPSETQKRQLELWLGQKFLPNKN